MAKTLQDECNDQRQTIARLNNEIRYAKQQQSLPLSDKAYWDGIIKGKEEEITGTLLYMSEIGCLPVDPPPPRPIPSLEIVAVEKTQAIQFLWWNSSQGSNLAADNSVPLVANKALVLRVYVNQLNLVSPPPSRITGEIVIDFQVGSFKPSKTLSPINGPIPARPATAINRGNSDHTLNFVVQASDCNDYFSCTVRVWDPDHWRDERYWSKDFGTEAVFVSVPQLRVLGVLINYTGNDATGKAMNLPAPTQADFISALSFVSRTYPIGSINHTGYITITFSGNLSAAKARDPTTGQQVGCGTGWDTLVNTLSSMRSISHHQDVYVGLLPAGVPTNISGGCGGNGVAVAPDGQGATLAQEIGHAFLGLQHAPCSIVPPNPDPSYPNYGGYPQGSIGEYGFGFDPVDPVIYDPRLTFDFMSYCRPNWVSPYTYQRLQTQIQSTHGAGLYALSLEMRELLYLNFRIHGNGGLDLLHSYHLPGRAPPVDVRKSSQVFCDLLNAQGQVIGSHQCHINASYQDPNGLPVEFHEILPWREEVATLRVYRAQEEVGTIQLPQQPPELGAPSLAFDGPGDSVVRIDWRGRHPDRSVTYTVRYSNDGGQTWRAVSEDLTAHRHEVNLDLLPGGEGCRFQVVASAVIRTSIVESEPFMVPQKPRRVHIISPAAGTTSRRGQLVVLRGCGYSPEFETSAADDLLWISNRDGVIGTGYEVITNALSVGWHKITLSVPDGMGGDASASIVITIDGGSRS
jgi:hypothetical protein